MQATYLPQSSAAGTAKAVAHARANDRDALRYLYVRYADEVYPLIASLSTDGRAALAVTQRLFRTLPEALGSFDAGAQEFSAWLRTAAARLAVDHGRRRNHETSRRARPPRGLTATTVASS